MESNSKSDMCRPRKFLSSYRPDKRFWMYDEWKFWNL